VLTWDHKAALAAADVVVAPLTRQALQLVSRQPQQRFIFIDKTDAATLGMEWGTGTPDLHAFEPGANHLQLLQTNGICTSICPPLESS